MTSSRRRRWLTGAGVSLGTVAVAAGVAWIAFAGSPEPGDVRIVTDDVALFWEVLDAAPPGSLAVRLQREYIDGGSPGVRGFVKGRIVSGEALAAMVERRRAAYDSIRAASLELSSLEPAIRAALWELERLYPPARFPDVFFVMGRFNSGGTSSLGGLLIGAEMVAGRPASIPPLVVHEAVHFNQPLLRSFGGTQLDMALREGIPSYIAYLATGIEPDTVRHGFGEAHEADLWEQFLADKDEPAGVSRWFYGGQPEEWPADLGYFFGFRIAEAYVAAASDSARAIADLIELDGAADFLAKSGYDPAS